jgi:hypothetical protein
MGGCASDLDPENGSIPTPAPGTMKLARFSVSVSDKGYGQDNTRAIPKPVTITRELGDGLVMKSTISATPMTRAGGGIANGASIIMIVTAASDAAGASPLGYQVCAVNGGKITFDLPEEGGPFNLSFFTANTAVALVGTDFVGGTPVAQDGGYYSLTSGTAKANDSYSEQVADGRSNFPDLMYGSILNVADVAGLEGRNLTLKHLTTELTWDLTEGSSKGNGLGNLEATYGPYMNTCSLYVSRIAGVESGSVPLHDSENDEGVFNYDETGSANTSADWNFRFRHADSGSKVTNVNNTTYFVPSDFGDEAPQIYINSITFKHATQVDKMYTGVSVPLFDGGDAAELLPGYSYTVTSTFSTTWPNKGQTKPVSGQWAASNIYWNGGELTFDQVNVDGEGTSGNRRGVYFKFGSLTGISPVGAFGPTTVVYRPIGSSGATNSGHVKELFGTGSWEDIPTFTGDEMYSFDYDADSFDDDQYMSPKRISTLGKSGIFGTDAINSVGGRGDICAYLTRGAWRLPAATEELINSSGGNASISVGNSDTGSTGMWYISGLASTLQAATDVTGASPEELGDYAHLWVRYPDNGTDAVAIPFAYRRDNSGKFTISSGQGKNYYSLGDFGQDLAGWAAPFITNLDMGSLTYGMASAWTPLFTYDQMQYAKPVRCVKN